MTPISAFDQFFFFTFSMLGNLGSPVDTLAALGGFLKAHFGAQFEIRLISQDDLQKTPNLAPREDTVLILFEGRPSCVV